MKLIDKDRKYLARDGQAHPIQVVKSKDSILVDAQGKTYIDFTMGWCVGNVGWSNRSIQQRIAKFKGPTYVSPNMLYQPWVELAELLIRIAPGKLQRCFRATGGTEAVEIALRAANAYTKRHKFISLAGSYHGDSIGALSVGAEEHRKQPGLLFKTHKIKPPLNQKTADKVEAWLKKEDVAALIMEPISCNLAVEIPEQIFMQRIEKMCKKYGTLLIMDEVATGFGRTGKIFATEHFNINPDIMCIAKAVTGGYGAMGATLVTQKIAQALAKDFSCYSTYGWLPLSVEAALANLHYILDHQKQLEKNTALMSAYFHKRLLAMKFKRTPHIRIQGLAIGVKFADNTYPSRIVEKARANGLILAEGPHAFTLFPALNIDKKTARAGLDILEKSV